jgi:hypothetical protein
MTLVQSIAHEVRAKGPVTTAQLQEITTAFYECEIKKEDVVRAVNILLGMGAIELDQDGFSFVTVSHGPRV